MGCLSGIVKYLLFIFNFLIVVCGVALIAVGSILIVNENKGISTFTEFSIGGFGIAVGAIIFFIAFFGCCGAIRENKCLLTTYAVILICLFLLQVVLGTLAFVAIRKGDGDEIHDKVVKVVEDVFDDYWIKQDKKNLKAISDVQQYFECCGVKGPKDFPNHTLPIPDSCYLDREPKPNNLFQKGCAEVFEDIMISNIKIIGGVAIGFAVVELVGAIFACVVRNRG